MTTKNHQEPIPELPIQGIYSFSGDSNVVRFEVQWTTKSFGVICDLDLHAYVFDERARFIERLDLSNNHTFDKAMMLVADQETTGQAQTSNVASESVKIDFRLVDPAVAAVLFVLDGGSKYFQLVQLMEVNMMPLNTSKTVSMPGQTAPLGLFTFSDKGRKENQAVGLAVLFRDGWTEEDAGKVQWKMRAIMEPIEVSAKRDKDDKVCP